MSSKFYSGFSLQNEEELFKNYAIKNDFTLAGFSYGAIKAFQEALTTNKRVDLLQLFSPAFFQIQEKKFLRMQLMFFKKDKISYTKEFLKNISYPSDTKVEKYFTQGAYEELDHLLSYVWKKEDLEKLIKKGTKIEVYLGSDDKIIDISKSSDFFKKYASVYYIKNVGHILQ